jgi:hypothetical protein
MMGEPVVALLALVVAPLVSWIPPLVDVVEVVDVAALADGLSAPERLGGVGCGFRSQAFSRPAASIKLVA